MTEPFECTATCATVEAGAGWQQIVTVDWRCARTDPHDPKDIDTYHEWVRAPRPQPRKEPQQ